MSGLADWFAVFRAGKHRASNGIEQAFSTRDLDAIVENYDSGSPSPCVITHEELYSPFGYAQVEALKRDGDTLLAKCQADSIEPQFASLVEAGRLHNRSVQLLPVETGWKLGHVAFLGAEPPAVEGLAPIAFSARGLTFASEKAWDTVEDARVGARIFRALKTLSEKAFGDEADRIVSQWEVDDAIEAVGAKREKARQGDPDMSGEYSQNQLDAAVATAREKARAAAKAESEAEHAALRAERRELARSKIETRIAGLIDDGKVTPAQAPGLAEFALGLDRGELEFSRGEGASAETVKTTPREWLFSFLGALPQQVRVGSHDLGEAPLVNGDDAGSIRAAALEYQASERAKGRIVTDAAAVRHVTGESV